MSMCNVIGVLGDDEDEIWETFRAAVELADTERSRLTLAKTCDDGRSYVWVTPFGFGGAYIPPPIDTPEAAERTLVRIAEAVPNSIPVTTQVLGANTQDSLMKLLRCGHYNAIVANHSLLSHCRRLRRELKRLDIQTFSVGEHHHEDRPEPHGGDLAGVATLGTVAVDFAPGG